MLKELLKLNENDNPNRSVIPLSANLLYHFTREGDFSRIIRDNTIRKGYYNVGAEQLNKTKPTKILGTSPREETRAVSFTRNKLLWLKNSWVVAGFMFERKQLERFYRLYPVQPDDEMDNYGKNFHYSYAWDEEVIFNIVKNVKNICFGLLLREDQIITRFIDVLDYLIEENITSSYDVYVQNKKGVIYKKLENEQDILQYKKMIEDIPYGYQSDLG